MTTNIYEGSSIERTTEVQLTTTGRIGTLRTTSIPEIHSSKKMSTKRQHLDTQTPDGNDRLLVQATDATRQDFSHIKTEKSASGFVIGVSVGVGIVVALTIVVIGLVLMCRRGKMCRPPSKTTGSHVNTTYSFATGIVSFSSPALSTNENAQHQQDNGEDHSHFCGKGIEHHIYSKTNSAFSDDCCHHKNNRNNAVENALNGTQIENKENVEADQYTKHRRQKDSGVTDNVYCRVNKYNHESKDNYSRAPHGNDKKRFRTTRDNQRIAKGTLTAEYEITCLKDSTKLVQRKNDGILDEGTDKYNTSCLGNLPLHHDSDYSKFGKSGDYNVVYFSGNNTSKAAINGTDDYTYNTFSNKNEDYNTVTLHRDTVAHATPSDETYNTLRNDKNDYNVVDFNGVCNAQLTMHHDDT